MEILKGTGHIPDCLHWWDKPQQEFLLKWADLNAQKKAHAKFTARLKQTTSVRWYVKLFNKVVLEATYSDPTILTGSFYKGLKWEVKQDPVGWSYTWQPDWLESIGHPFRWGTHGHCQLTWYLTKCPLHKPLQPNQCNATSYNTSISISSLCWSLLIHWWEGQVYARRSLLWVWQVRPLSPQLSRWATTCADCNCRACSQPPVHRYLTISYPATTKELECPTEPVTPADENVRIPPCAPTSIVSQNTVVVSAITPYQLVRLLTAPITLQ